MYRVHFVQGVKILENVGLILKIIMFSFFILRIFFAQELKHQKLQPKNFSPGL